MYKTKTMKENGLAVLDDGMAENRRIILRVHLSKIRISQGGLFNFGNLFQRPFSNGSSPFAGAVFVDAHEIILIARRVENFRHHLLRAFRAQPVR